MSHRFGRFELQPVQRALLIDGQSAALGARAFDMLLALIERSDRVVSGRELFELVWPGLVVEENNLRQQIAALRKVLGAEAIVTVPGRGYRFALLLGAEGGHAEPAPVAILPERPSIAVLPFSVLSQDPRIGFFSDGLAQDVITLLARVPGFLLISQGSSFEFRKRSESISSIAQSLGVRYLVEGSVREMAGNGVRVSTQLVEAESGQVLWSGSVDGSRDQTADLQVAIAHGIISELEPELTRAEISWIRRRRPDNVQAWGHYHQGVAAIGMKGWTEDAVREACLEFKSALAEDPSFGLACAQYGLIRALALTTGLIEASPGDAAEALEAAERALLLDDGHSQVLGYVGCALADLGQRERGAEILKRALSIDPSNAQAHVALGATFALGGDALAGIEHMRHGIRISPRDRRLGFWGWFLGLTLLRAGRREEALQEACTSASRDPRLYLSRILQSATLLLLDRSLEAQEAFATARRLRTVLTRDEVKLSHGTWIADVIEPLWGESVVADTGMSHRADNPVSRPISAQP